MSMHVSYTVTHILIYSCNTWLIFPQDFSIPSLYNELRNKIMTNQGMSRWSLSTIKGEVTNIINNPVSNNSFIHIFIYFYINIELKNLKQIMRKEFSAQTCIKNVTAHAKRGNPGFGLNTTLDIDVCYVFIFTTV